MIDFPVLTEKVLRQWHIMVLMIDDRLIECSLSGWSETQRQRREKSLAVILISIVLVFLSCHSLKLYLAFYKVNQIETLVLALSVFEN